MVTKRITLDELRQLDVYKRQAKGGGGATAAYSADRGAKNGSDGTSYGYGGEGGAKGVAYSDAALNGSDGSDGWVIITYNYDEQTVLYPSGTSGIITLTSNQPFFEENMVGDSIKLYQEIATKTAVNSSGGEGTGSALLDVYKRQYQGGH